MASKARKITTRAKLNGIDDADTARATYTWWGRTDSTRRAEVSHICCIPERACVRSSPGKERKEKKSLRRPGAACIKERSLN
eukprot:1145754-Pelagomonas_calceolata.AAC.1